MICKHTNATDSTLTLTRKPPSAETTHETWFCSCSECGKATDACLTKHEAQLRGQLGWWDEPVTCSVCRFSHVETRRGERVLYCYERGYGMPTDKDATCPKGIRRDA